MTTEEKERCRDCDRPATWFWPGSSVESAAYFCGYHKRAYITTYRLLKREPEPRP